MSKRRWAFVIAILLVTVMCVRRRSDPVDTVTPTAPQARVGWRSDPVPLPPGVIAPRGTLLLGDLHGTRELPGFVARLVETLATDQPVVLALEMRADQLPSIDAFLASDGGPAARAAALRDPWWLDAYQDGRRSVAMLEILERVRALRKAGAQVDIACFDPPLAMPIDAEAREDGMARNLIALRAARPEATLLVYAGNLHTIRKGVAFKPGFQWMAMRMAAAGIRFVTLDARYSGGTAWTCRSASPEDCGVEPVKGVPHEPGVRLEGSPDGNYDGWFGVGSITASPPAARPSPGSGQPKNRVARFSPLNRGSRPL